MRTNHSATAAFLVSHWSWVTNFSVYPSTAQGLRKRDEHPAYMAYFTFIIVIIIIKGIYIAQVCKGHRCAVDTDGSMVT